MRELGASVFDAEAKLSNLIPIGETRLLGDGKWQVAAVPARATNQACVDCHNGMWRGGERIVLNDVVGVGMYAYRPAKPHPALDKEIKSYPRLYDFE